MTRVATLSLSVLLFSLVGLLGCTPEAKNANKSAKKDRSLESKCVRLEGDFRQACEARDNYRTELTSIEQQRDGLNLQVSRMKKEMENLQLQIRSLSGELASARTSGDQWRQERDTFAEHINRLSKELNEQQDMIAAQTKQIEDSKADAEAVKEQFDTFRQLLRTQIDQAEAAVNLRDEDQPQAPAMMPIVGL